MADAFHEIAVASKNIGPMIDEVIAIAGIQHAFGQGHADRGGDALPERAGGGLDPGQMTIFGMTGAGTAKLAEVLDVLDGGAGIAGEIEQSIEQHRTVAG